MTWQSLFDSRHRGQTLPPLHTGDTVWLPNVVLGDIVVEFDIPRFNGN